MFRRHTRSPLVLPRCGGMRRHEARTALINHYTLGWLKVIFISFEHGCRYLIYVWWVVNESWLNLEHGLGMYFVPRLHVRVFP